MSFFNKVAEVLAETPEDFAQAVFSRTGRPQEAKHLFILMLLNNMLNEEMILTGTGRALIDAVSAREIEESHQGALMRFMCEDAEFACSHIEPAVSALIASGQDRLSDKSFWREMGQEIASRFPGRDDLVRITLHILYADALKCSFNEAVEILGE